MAETWVELRVHGVSGTPPESMLNVDRVVQVAGDEFGRTFRRADRLGTELTEPRDHMIEAYHWGRLTSGSVVQGLWLLLAPFGLINAAQFTLERPGSLPARAAHTVAGAMLRLVGLALTVLFVLAAAVITLDLWAWQRSGATDGFPYLLALAGPVALLVVYYVLIRSEPALNEVVGALPDAESPEQPSELVRAGFFEGNPDAPALQLLHFAAGLSVVAVLGFAPAAQRSDPFGQTLFVAACGMLAVVAAVVVGFGDPEGSASTSWRSRADQTRRNLSMGVGWVLWTSSALLVVVAAVHVCSAPPQRAVDPATLPHYPGMDLLSYLVMLAAVGGLLVLIVANGVVAALQQGSQARSSDRFAPYARGMACTLVASFGTFLGVGYVGAFTTVVARSLATTERPVAVPELLSRVVYAWGVTAVLLVLVVGVALSCRCFGSTRLRRLATADFARPDGERPPLPIPRRWIRRVAGAIWVGRLKNRMVGLLLLFLALGAVLTGFVGYELWPQLGDPAAWPRLSDEPRDAPGLLRMISESERGGAGPFRIFLLAVGTSALTLLATVLFFLGRTAVLGEPARRGVNVLWDVIAFWPRSAHPFVPAAYSQRAVPDLVERITWHLDRPGAPGTGRRVVLCAHSQGSLLSFAALLRMDLVAPGQLDRVGLVTFGSQLQVMFSRGFPAYVNHEAITRLFDRLNGAWRNLYRDTDPLAGPVLSWDHGSARPQHVGLGGTEIGPSRRGGGREEFGPDWRLYDPPVPAGPTLQEAPLLDLRGHSDYWLDPAWAAALGQVRRRPARPAAATAHV